MSRKRMMLTLVAVGVAVGIIMGYYAGATWWSLLIVVVAVAIAGFGLRLIDMRNKRQKELSKKPTGK